MIYITIDGDDIGQMITSSYLKNDLHELSKINRVVNEKTLLISKFLKEQGFNIIFCAADGVAGFIDQIAIDKVFGGVSKSMLKKSRLNFDKIEKCK